ncbi:hypothetical protein Dsin_017403 [Dipteronia sinensis]|uniref:DUF4283 domain-containing protein n=1 Tax=Dipteronia sinensis TaxID=43782 RepID=A0AAE0AG69_9ROSI|nr:hypothetical protein Dsin_017403 [Dipteronia sinensis]
MRLVRMNADEVAILCGALSLKEKKGPLMPFQVDLKDEGEKRLALCLVGKVLSNKLVNREAFIHLIPRIWKIKREVDIEVVDGNVFSFTFMSADDRRMVLHEGLVEGRSTNRVVVPEGSHVIPVEKPEKETLGLGRKSGIQLQQNEENRGRRCHQDRISKNLEDLFAKETTVNSGKESKLADIGSQ